MNADVVFSPLLLRLTWAVGLIAAGLLVYHLANRLILARLHARLPGLNDIRQGVPLLVYFTTPTCAPCKTVQRPAIQRLQECLGERLQVIEIDAAARPDVAGQWGVMSVPTTFIIDASGQPRYVNHGVTPQDKLLRQLEDILSLSPGSHG